VSEDWFHRRTHDWGQWSLEDLRHAKQRTGSRVSLVLPARDEAATIGGIVGRLTSLRDAGLVDELVVIDSDSSDDTAAVAATAGAVVLRAADVRPDRGPARARRCGSRCSSPPGTCWCSWTPTWSSGTRTS
jgi:glucosyl-3-phosphoglycerate synthase